MMKLIKMASLCASMLLFGSCEKEFLEAKPKKSLLVPSTLADMQSLLDNVSLMNLRPALSDIAGGEFVLADNGLLRVSTAPERGIYLMEADPYQGAVVADWDKPYEQVFVANVVLEGLDGMQTPQAKELRGAALFFRARAFFGLAQHFCRAYRPASATQDPGIPLPLASDVNRRYPRGSLEQSYSRILDDLQEAVGLLGDGIRPLNRPTRRAGLALLARVNLQMGRFQLAGELAGQVLESSDALIDFNTVRTGSFNVFPEILPNGNAELIFFESRMGYGFFGNAVRRVNPGLLAIYGPQDLRRSVLFYHTAAGAAYFSGFDGLGNAEMMLIAAESEIRADRLEQGMALLNRLWANRCRSSGFEPLIANDRSQAMAILLAERERELVWRGLRWADLKRLNAEGTFAKVLTRTYNGVEYRLEPGDPRYVFPIPEDEIRESGIQQN